MASLTRPGIGGAGMCGPGEQREAQEDAGGRSQGSQQNPLSSSVDAALRDRADVGFLILGRVPVGSHTSVWAFGMLTATVGTHPFLT